MFVFSLPHQDPGSTVLTGQEIGRVRERERLSSEMLKRDFAQMFCFGHQKSTEGQTTTARLAAEVERRMSWWLKMR